ncbi:MAG TPA: fructosamine kinase family protein [Steroidobacteraceae bacterium]
MSEHLGMASLAAAISKDLGASLRPRPAHRATGGSINECYRWESDAGPVFVKVGSAEDHTMFAAEAAGLEELREARAVRVPRVRSVGRMRMHAWLALEWIQFNGTATAAAESALGERLALQHRHTATVFGWHRDNTIGRTPQSNGRSESWVEFFRERRLRYQLDLATRNGYSAQLRPQADELLEKLGGLFTDYRPVASLLHGDLWGGNWGATEAGEPVIFDPAVYYGDREADLAMTYLFSGFGPDFYAAYQAAWGMDAGARTRRDLYNLYHVLNHVNLFGGGYIPQAQAVIRGLLALLR